MDNIHDVPSQDIIVEVIDLGISSSSGVPLYQYEGSVFQSKCLQVNSRVNDSTGLRLHGGAHVAVRMLYQYLNRIFLSTMFKESK